MEFFNLLTLLIIMIQFGIEHVAWSELLTIAPVIGALGLWIFYLIRQNDYLNEQLRIERQERNDERKEMNAVVKDMTDIIDRAYSAIESGNILTVQTIKSEAENIKVRLKSLSDKIDNVDKHRNN